MGLNQGKLPFLKSRSRLHFEGGGTGLQLVICCCWGDASEGDVAVTAATVCTNRGRARNKIMTDCSLKTQVTAETTRGLSSILGIFSQSSLSIVNIS